MKKVNRKFLEEQVKKVLQEEKEASGFIPSDCKPPPQSGEGGFFSQLFTKEMLLGMLFGMPESWDAVGDDMTMRIDWGSSTGAQFRKAAYINRLKGADVYLFRFLKPELDAAMNATATIRAQIFDDFYNIIDEYTPRFQKVSVKSKGKTLGFFGEDSVEDIFRDFIDAVEDVKEKHGLNDPEPSGYAWLKKVGPPGMPGINMPSVDMARYTKATEGYKKQAIKNYTKFLSSTRDKKKIEQRLETDIVRNIGPLYIQNGIESFRDIYDYFRNKNKGGKMLDMINAAAYQKKLKDSPVFWAYADIAISISMTLFTVATLGGGAAVQGGVQGTRVAGAAAKVVQAADKGSKAAKAAVSIGRAAATTYKALNWPSKALIAGLEKTNQIILSRFQNMFIRSASKITTGAAKLGVNITKSMPAMFVETSITMSNVTKTLDFQTRKYAKVLQQYQNVIENNQFDSSKMPSDLGDTAEYFSEFGSIAAAAAQSALSSDEEGQQKEPKEEKPTGDKIPPEKLQELKAKLEEQLIEIYDEMEKAAYSDFGGLRKKCGANFSAVVAEKKTRKQMLLDSFKQNPPNLKAHYNLLYDMQGYRDLLNDMATDLAKKGKEVDAHANKMLSSAGEADQIKAGNMKVAGGEIILSRSFSSKTAAVAKTPEPTPGSQSVDPETTQKPVMTADIPKSFGSNEKTSDEILKDLESSLGGQLAESNQENVIRVNVGYKDALEYSKGNKDFSPEKTITNINKIVDLIQSKGMIASITPVAKEKSFPTKAEGEKFDDFSKTINTHIKNKNVSTVKARPGEKPNDKKVDAAQVAKDDIIIVGDSNAAALAYWGKHKGRTKWPEDYVKHPKYATGGTKIYVDSKTKEPLEPAIGAARTGYILSRVKMWYKDKGENYRPSLAIIHMGYNDRDQAPTEGFSNIQKTVDFLSSKGVSDIRVVLPKGDPKHKKNADVAEWMSALSDRLKNELQGAKLIPNNGRFGKKSDGYHFVNNLKIYNDALSGVTVAGSSEPKPTVKPTSANLSGGAKKYYPVIKKEAEKLGYPVPVAMGVAYAESNFRPNLVSSAGAVGLMQLMKVTAKDVGVSVDDRADPETNVRGALTYISKNVPRYFQGDMKKYKTKIQWNDLSEEQKIKFGLYGFQQGVRGVVTGVSYRGQRMHRGLVAFDDPEEFLSYMKAWYIKRFKYDYVTKILDYANRYGGSFEVSDASSDTGVTTQTQAQTAAPTADQEKEVTYKQDIEKIQSFEGVVGVVYDMLNIQGQNMIGKGSDLNQFAKMVDETNLSKYKKDVDNYMKLVHKKNLPSLTRQFYNELEAAGDDKEKRELANKKIAYFHRPIFYSEVDIKALSNIQGTAITFAFEPGSKKASVSFEGSEKFYKQDHENNTELKKFTTKMNVIRESLGSLLRKLESFSKTEPENKKDISVYYEFLTGLKKVMDKTIPIIDSSQESALRRSYATNILNRALQKLTYR